MIRFLFTLSLIFWGMGKLAYTQGVAQKLTSHLSTYHIEKVYAGHDKPFYLPGDTIWCKIYLLEGRTHRSFEGQPVVYADWIAPNGEKQQSFTLKIKNGSTPLDIQTQAEDSAGIYTLRVYSQYQRNFDQHFLFQKEIRLLGKDDITEKEQKAPGGFSVRFFPEGGYLVAGLESNIAFKAQNDLGENIVVNGILLNEANEKIGDLKTLHEGMGLFKFTPEKGKKYSAEIRYEGYRKRFALPEILPQGFSLNVNSRSGDQILIKLGTNLQAGLSGCTLIGHVRGQIFLARELEAGLPSLSVRKDLIPSGIVHFTLFDQGQRPVCERLVFNKNPAERVDLNLQVEKNVYGKREAIKLQLVPTLQDRIQASQLSVSVYYEGSTDLTVNESNILNYLWLQSDLRGRINNIQQYFETDNTTTNSLLDLLLMTHAWRRFRWQSVLSGQSPSIVYPPEEHLSVAGKVTKAGKEQPVKADVLLNVLSEEQFTALNVTTEADGLFYFKGFDFQDTTDILIQANIHQSKKKKKLKEDKVEPTGNKNVSIQILELNELDFIDSVSIPAQMHLDQTLQQYAYQVEQNRQLDSLNNPLWTIDLETVTVRSGLNRAQLREQTIKKQYREKGLFYFHSTNKFLTDDPLYAGFQNNNIFDLIKVVVPNTTRVRVNGEDKIIYGRFSSQVEAKIVLDGQMVPPNLLMNIDPDRIAVIDVLTGYYASLYTKSGVVISLVSRNPDEIDHRRPGIISFAHPGYYQAREFYSPDYDLAGTAEQKPDFRTVLYWNPDVRIAGTPENLSFFTGDQAGHYLILVEGITDAGIPFYKTERVIVED
ncbi:MAG: hypothetical protein R2824_02720 [Saprospiraceae bacterium]|nr:hypothetical protein [Lewinella sp.]